MRLFSSVIALFIMLTIGGHALAQSEFPISCEDVERIQVWRLRGQVWRLPPVEGYSYVVILLLTDKAGERLAKLYNATEETPVFVDGHSFDTKRIDLITSRGRIISDAPAMDTFREGYAIFSKKKAEDAFAAARAVCPEKAPRKLLTDGS